MSPQREHAKRAGYPRYYEHKKPCRKGHISERLTSSGVCVECKKESAARHRDKAAGDRIGKRIEARWGAKL